MSTLSTLVAVSLVLVGCSAQADPSAASKVPDSRPTSAPSSRPSAPAAQDLHAAFDAMLRRHVRDESVDYLTWRERDGEGLDRYLDTLERVDASALGQSERLAFYINLYNATMVDTILDRVDASYTTAEDGHGVFNEPLVRLSTGTVSLNHLEHELVRKQFDEPRIHVALVCGARSCPPLLPRAYAGADLEDVLEASMKKFVTGGVRNKIGDKLELSALFDWYADDFGGKDGVPAYVARYAGQQAVGKPVSFLEYSWKLNMASPVDGEWVKLTKAEGDLDEGAFVRVVARSGDRVSVRTATTGQVELSAASVAAAF